MPPKGVPCLPWLCSGVKTIKRASIKPSQSKPKSKSTPPAMVIGSFKLNNGKVDITTDQRISFELAITPGAKQALKASGKANGTNQAGTYGMALVQWKKGPDAKVTEYFPFADLKNLAKRLSKQRALAVYDRWLYGE